MLKKWFFTFGIVGTMAVLAIPLCFRVTGRLMSPRILYAICPFALFAISDPSNWWDRAPMWSIMVLGNALLYGGLAALVRLSIDSKREEARKAQESPFHNHRERIKPGGPRSA